MTRPLLRRLDKLAGKQAQAITHTMVTENGTAWLRMEAPGVVIMLPDNGRDTTTTQEASP